MAQSRGSLHPKEYEIALIAGDEVHIQKHLFSECIDFFDNDRFFAVASDYVITLKIESD